MKLKLLRILDPEFRSAIRSLGASPAMPIKTRYWLAKGLRAIEAEVDDLEKTRVSLIKAKGTQREDGEYQIPATDVTALREYNDALKELLEGEVEISLPTGVKLTDQTQLTAGELSKVLDLVEDPNEPPAEPPKP